VEVLQRLSGLGEIVDSYLSGRFSGIDAARAAKDAHGEFEDSLSGDRTSPMERLFIRTFWAIVLLDEPAEHRTQDGELRYLRQCIEDPSAFSEEGADRPYLEGEDA
jgi:hypothetical protein